MESRTHGAQRDVHSYPSAGTNRIRFYGFAAYPHLRPVHEQGHPEARRILAEIAP